jgi:hypothetical protein
MASKVTQFIRSDPCLTMAIKIFRAKNHLRSGTKTSSAQQRRLAALFADMTEDAEDDDDDDDDEYGAAADMCDDRLRDIGASIEALKVDIHADLDAMEEV